MDINSLREEIDNRKKQLDNRKNVLGEKTQVSVTGDQFLRELMHSTTTGQETNASVKVKAVDKVAEGKISGNAVDPNILNHVPSSSSTPNATPIHQPSAAEVARMNEAKRIKEMGNTPLPQSSNAGMADAISQYQNIPPVGAPMNNNNMLTEQQMLAKFNQNAGLQQTTAPNTLIAEQVNSVATQLLNENFGNLFAEAMKNSIIESYKAEVIKEAINENRSVIEQIVRDTIIDLQKKAQSKK